MTHEEEVKQMTREQLAEFLAKQRFFGMGPAYVLYWLGLEASK